MTTVSPLVFGEVLFDHFPDGKKVLGGAPFNVAWHLQGWGHNPLFLSSLGNDTEAQDIRSQMESWGMNKEMLQQHSSLPTGRVQVLLEENEPTFDIVSQVAYDEILLPQESLRWNDSPLLYHGSLAARSQVSQDTLRKLRDLGIPTFVDINLRSPWDNSNTLPILPQLLQGIDWLKLNQDELAKLSEQALETNEKVKEVATQLRQELGCQAIWVTCGDKGAYVVDKDECLHAPAPRPQPFVDTVGAGDAFASVVIHGLLSGWSHVKILQHATAFASRVCEHVGATQTQRSFYTLT